MFETGYLTIASFRGAPIRIHWTAPVGALLLGGFRFVPGFWVGFLLLVLVHEMGHAWLVYRLRLEALAIDVHGFGGRCLYAGEPTLRDRSIVAWGGVMAQAILLGLTYGAVLVLGSPQSAFTAELTSALTRTNLILIALNLLPFPPLDGAEAWQLFRRRKRRPRRPSPPKKPRARTKRADRPSNPDARPIDHEDVAESVRQALTKASEEAAQRRREKDKS